MNPVALDPATIDNDGRRFRVLDDLSDPASKLQAAGWHRLSVYFRPDHDRPLPEPRPPADWLLDLSALFDAMFGPSDWRALSPVLRRADTPTQADQYQVRAVTRDGAESGWFTPAELGQSAIPEVVALFDRDSELDGITFALADGGALHFRKGQ